MENFRNLIIHADIMEIEIEIEIEIGIGIEPEAPILEALVEKIDAERLAEPVIYRPICETSFGISCIVILKWS